MNGGVERPIGLCQGVRLEVERVGEIRIALYAYIQEQALYNFIIYFYD